jgi:hypothetical protein
VTLAKLLEQTKEGGAMLAAAREDARPACVAAVRKLEAALVAVLDGEKLRGLPVLHEGDARYCGARARGKRIDGTLGEKPTLVVNECGRLMFAVVPALLHDAVERPAQDDELLAEDAEDVARAVEEALLRHAASVDQRTARFERLSALARRLSAALG